MTTTVYKILLFMKRRPGMTMADFMDYYENYHVPLALKSASGLAGYTRRYLTPQANAAIVRHGGAAAMRSMSQARLCPYIHSYASAHSTPSAVALRAGGSCRESRTRAL
jgi:hypothetical protein